MSAYDCPTCGHAKMGHADDGCHALVRCKCGRDDPCDAEIARLREALALALDGWDRKLDVYELARRRTLMQRALGVTRVPGDKGTTFARGGGR